MLNLHKTITVGDLLRLAGQFNEEIRLKVNPEYTRGQVELICDAAGIPLDCRQVVEDEIKKQSDAFFHS